MRKHGIMKYKWQISLITAVIFCLTLVPFPKSSVTTVSADEITDSVTKLPVAVLVGDCMSANDLGTDWDPVNYNGKLNEYKNGVYESSFDLKPGTYQYKIAMNGSWDESYGSSDGNITLNVAEESKVYFRLDYNDKVVYDSINNPEQFKTKATLVGNINGVIENGESWNPENDVELDYVGGGIYKGTFNVTEEAQNSDYQLEYKVAYDGIWSNGEVADNKVVTIPAGTDTITIIADYLNNYVTDSVSNANISNTVSLIGSVRSGDTTWEAENTDYDMYDIADGVYAIAEYLDAGSYEYKGIINHSWDNGGIPANGNVQLTVDEAQYVIFVADLNNGTIIDSVNNLSDVNEVLGSETEVVEPGDVVESPIFNEDGSITFRMKYDGDSLFLVGSMNNWDANSAFEMTKNNEGVFEVTIFLEPGAYEYKYITTLGSWDEAFTDPGNPNTSNGNSLVVVKGDSDIVSPEINEDGTVTFRAEYDGDTLNLVGTMNGWDNVGIPMTKNDEGVFEVTLSLQAGVYEYKYFPVSGSWDNGFIDSANDLMNNGNSVLNMPGLALTVADSVEVNTTTELTASIYDESGNASEADPEWSLENEINGVSLEGNVLTVSSDADNSEKIQVKAEQDGYVATAEIEILSNMYTYIINYYRPNGDYTDWNLWLWEPNRNGAAYEFNKNDEAEDGFVRAEYKFSSDVLNFIIRKGAWEEKDTDVDRSIEVQEGNTVEVWLVAGDENVYYTRDTANTSAKIKAAIMDSSNEILVTASADISDEELDTFELVEAASGDEISVTATRVDEDQVKLTVDKEVFGLVSVNIDVTKQYQVSSANMDAKDVTMRKILNDEQYYYDGDDLGFTYSKDSTTFKVWAPTASDVTLVTYDDAGSYDSYGYVNNNKDGNETAMERADNGVWSVTVPEDLNGTYYMYKVSFANGTVNYAVDPYAKAVSANGQRSVVVNLDSTDPTGWANTSKPVFMDMTDAIIYEMHIRDFTISDDSGVSDSGKYTGLTETGTTVEGTDIQTGVDHLADLGITHVQIQPSFDYASVNEVGSDDQYNWGYDPQNYNVPEGYYSTDATSPTTRIIEFKEMVQALHEKGIRVVMDVVYNHTSSVGGSPFDAVVPGYYYRTSDTGSYTNGSGCGNEIATERPMVRKYIKDSVKYWSTEYQVDGFRFDLGGLIDTTTMTEITNELRDEVDPSIIVYCEPWQAGGSSLAASSQTLKGSQSGNGFAVFNDNFRAAIKGGSDDATTGFATGADGKEDVIVAGVEGSINDFTSSPSETINYVTAHDNLNLWDKIVVAAGLDDEANFLSLSDGQLTGDSAANYSSVEEAVEASDPYAMITEDNVLDNELVKRDLLATAITMTSQGIPFFQAGDEFLRSKYGDHNSYKSSDAINEINWNNKVEFQEVYDYYKGLIELRKTHPAFRMSTKSAVESNLVVNKSEDNIIVFELKDYANGDAWNNIVVIYNGNNSEEQVDLPSTADWNVVVNDKTAGNDVIETLKSSNTATVAPLSVMVLYDETVETEVQEPTTIEVSSDNIGINPDGYKFLTTKVKDQNGRVISNADVNYEVADKDVVSFDKSNGKITALKEGQTTITLTCGSATKVVNVSVEKLVAKSIEISGADNLYETKEIELSASVKDQFDQPMYDAEVEWSSSNEEVATVSNFGVVKGIKHGSVTITATLDGVSATKKITVNKYTKKYIQFTYVRDDEDYDGWNIWTWQTGLEDGEKDFTTFEDGVAVAKFEIAPDTSSVGFILRKGTDWAEKDPYDSDRYITIDPSMTVTKVTVTSGVGEFFTVPAITNAEINDGNLYFKYRDDDLYEENAQDTIDNVQVKVTSPSGETNKYKMDYDDLNEYFAYTDEGIVEGTYKYSFIETVNGVETESDEYEITYSPLDINVSAEASLLEVDSDDNTVITAKLSGEDVEEDNIRNIYMDLTEVGGNSKVYMDLALLSNGEISESIGIKDSVTAGAKEIPVVVVDKNGESHKTTVEITVKSRVAVDDNDFSFDESRIYFTVTDRFFNGDSSNDDPNGNNYSEDGAATYHGGDLQGLEEKIPYLSDLGINTIWITPIVENTDFNQMFASGGEQYSYHGYWAKDFTKLDPHLGTLDDLKSLIDTAHNSGIKIMVDVVLNHVGYGMKEDDANVGANNYPTESAREVFKGMLREASGNDFTTQEVSGLPDLETEDPDVRAQIIAWQTAWIERATTDSGNTIDYFRVDTVKHVDTATLKAFKSELTNIDSDFKLLGEYYGADINNTADQLDNGQMDGLLDFQYKSKAKDFVNGSVESVSSYLDERASEIDNTNLMAQFLSSHDEDGFLTTVDNDLSKQMLAAALQITDKGIPVIYYGEELGASGVNANDANRYDMPWDREDDSEYSDIYNHYKTLLNIRKEYTEIFSKGDRTTIAASDEEGYAAFERTYNGQSLVVALNVKDADNVVTLDVPYSVGATVEDLYSNTEYVVDENGQVTVTIPAMAEGGTVILASNETEEVPVVTTVEISGDDTVVEGNEITLTATAKDQNDEVMEGGDVSWTSSDEEVAIVNEEGVVTAIKAGTVTITAKIDNVIATKKITVTSKSSENTGEDDDDDNSGNNGGSTNSDDNNGGSSNTNVSDDNGNTNSVNVNQSKGDNGSMPNTGGQNSIYYLIIGFVVVLAGLTLAFKKKKVIK